MNKWMIFGETTLFLETPKYNLSKLDINIYQST